MNNFFSLIFWEDVIKIGKDWTLHELPGLIIIIILLAISLRTVNILLSGVKSRLSKRAVKNIKYDFEESAKRINTLFGISKASSKIIIWSIFAMLILNKLGINIAPILASAGIFGLAIGFGAQELVRDFISGFFILLENQIRTGDVAIINGTSGSVEKIELRTITLRDFSGIVHIFQNGKINSLSNMTKEWSAILIDISVAYKEKIEQVLEIMRNIGDEMLNDDQISKSILAPVELYGVNKFADSAMIVTVRIKTKPGMQWSMGREYRNRIKKSFDKNNIQIPFPATTIFMGEKPNPIDLKISELEK